MQKKNRISLAKWVEETRIQQLLKVAMMCDLRIKTFKDTMKTQSKKSKMLVLISIILNLQVRKLQFTTLRTLTDSTTVEEATITTATNQSKITWWRLISTMKSLMTVNDVTIKININYGLKKASSHSVPLPTRWCSD